MKNITKSTLAIFASAFVTVFLMTGQGKAGVVVGGDVVITYNASGPGQFNGGLGITQSAFQLYDRSNELNPTPPLISSTPSVAGDALSHDIVLGGPLRVTNLNYNEGGLSLNDIWSTGQTVSVDGRTRFEVDGFFPQFITFGDYNIVNQAGSLIFRDTGFNNLTNIWNTSNVTVNSVDASHLQISGDLLLHPDLVGFLGAPAGTNVGTFTINAFTAVPEPSSLLLMTIPAIGLAWRRRKMRALARAARTESVAQ